MTEYCNIPFHFCDGLVGGTKRFPSGKKEQQCFFHLMVYQPERAAVKRAPCNINLTSAQIEKVA